MNIKTYTFSKGKNEPKNEDKFGYSNDVIVLSDGATDKTGLLFDGKTGGELIAQLVVDESLKVNFNGQDLVRHLAKKVVELYKEINPEAINDSSKRSSATLVCARLVDGKIIITQVGDTSFRINGVDLYTNNKLIDEENAKIRSDFIKETGDVAGGREQIIDNLKIQHQYQNNSESEYGYGCVDGTDVPQKFVKIFEFPLVDIETIELISDGYFSIPDEVSIEAYEKQYEIVEREDPDKYIKYLSTKSTDDRTVVIATLSKD